jgi:hypothetical protein
VNQFSGTNGYAVSIVLNKLCTTRLQNFDENFPPLLLIYLYHGF